MAETQHIAAEQLCSLTGLSDRRHRQIAKDGYFPPPINGQYQMAVTLQGMFRYYRELSAKRSSTVEDEKQKKLAAERKIAELTLSKLRGEVFKAGSVVRCWENITLTVRQKFLGMENKISTRLDFSDEQRAGLRKEIEETLSELAKPITYGKFDSEIDASSGVPESGDDDGTATSD